MELSVLERLHEMAFLQNIEVVRHDLPERVCGLYFEEGACRSITINSAVKTAGEEVGVMAEELGHSVFGGGDLFFPGGVDPVLRRRAELRAKNYAYRLVLPPKKLEKALKSGAALFEIAEQFSVSEDFVENAVEAYRLKGLICQAAPRLAVCD